MRKQIIKFYYLKISISGSMFTCKCLTSTLSRECIRKVLIGLHRDEQSCLCHCSLHATKSGFLRNVAF